MQQLHNDYYVSIRKQDPLKQGLKLGSDLRVSFVHLTIRKQDPLKQGLKHLLQKYNFWYLIIRKQDPLKQGLKQYLIQHSINYMANSKARSTKTRIETKKMLSGVLCMFAEFESKIH